ncbi:MAG: hypothetical protein ACRC35_05815 [Angustibacter sp.]
MSYFTTVIGRRGSGWRTLDVDLDDLDTLDDLTELCAADGSDPLLAIIEQEDAWFALVRVDASGGEPRVFVSDLPAAEAGRYGDLLADVDVAVPAVAVTDPAEGDEPSPDPDDPVLHVVDADLAGASTAAPSVATWAGDAGLLSDVGLPASELVELVVANPDDPATVMAEVSERCGFDVLLDTVR